MPKLDMRTKEDLEKAIRNLAAAYTPEWRFQKENPDMGSVLAGLFAKLMEETIQVYNQMPMQNQRMFLDMLGVEPLPAKAAEGYVVFRLAKPDLPEAVVKAGTDVAANGPDGLIRYEVTEDVSVTAAGVRLVRDGEERRWYLCFDRVPGQGVIQLLFSAEQGAEPPGAGIVLEYRDNNGWMPLQAEDLTDGLRHTGIVRLPTDFPWKESVICGERGYFIRVRPGAGMALPPEGAGVWINAAPVRARKAGKQGNLPVQCDLSLSRQVGYVSDVTNPLALSGGTGEEIMSHAIIRGSARIRHQFRAVTPGDMERLVYEQYPDVKRVKCFTGFDGSGSPRSGAVTVVILSADYEEERRCFYRIREQMTEFLNRHAHEILVRRGSLFVAAPVPVYLHIRCELCATGYREVQQVQIEAKDTVSRFLHPVTGNHDQNGWELGEIPDYEQLRACLLGVSGVRYIRTLRIAYEMDTAEGKREVLWERIRKLPWGLPEKGMCRIQVFAEGSYGDVCGRLE